MKVFAVLVCFNNEAYIDECIGSFLRSSFPVGIVVVENASADDSLKKLRKYGKQITILPQKENLGFGIGNNLGAKYALDHGADWILWQNMDTKIAPDCIEKLIRAAGTTGKDAIFSPFPMTYSNLPDLGFFANALSPDSGEMEVRKFVADLYGRKTPAICYRSNLLAGASLFVSSEVLKKAGGFCELFFPAYYEDSELFQRYQYYGCRLFFVPEAVFYHDLENRSGGRITYSHLLCGEAYYAALNPALSFSRTYGQSLLLRFLKSVLFFLSLNMPRFKEEFPAFLMLVFMWRRVRKWRKRVLNKESFGLKDSLDGVPFPIYLSKYRETSSRSVP
ncbi:MAG: glycosyltransferase family 2 protein [Lentisphaeria bacterium]|nr:glycosyltransferase family 2 protein [Lentisphaeria bacterium]